MIPYTLSENDMKFVAPNGFTTGNQFFEYLRDHLDYLVHEARINEEGGSNGSVGKMMSVGLHCRVVGRAGRISGLEKFLGLFCACSCIIRIFNDDFISQITLHLMVKKCGYADAMKLLSIGMKIIGKMNGVKRQKLCYTGKSTPQTLSATCSLYHVRPLFYCSAVLSSKKDCLFNSYTTFLILT